MTKLTPTIHGAWRVIDGQLVDESVVLIVEPGAVDPIEHVTDPGLSSSELHTAEPGEPLPPIAPAQSRHSVAPLAPTPRRKRASKAQ